MSHVPGHQEKPTGRRLASLTLGALGVVFGDIGTSPLYTLRECLHGAHGVAPTPEHVLGVVSLVFSALMLIISVKYVGYILRADNQGEGGILALMALVTRRSELGARATKVTVMLALFGAALLFGDGMITPAITVLGAVEGLTVAAPGLSHLVVPISIAILIGLFWVQERGTAAVGAVFGPVMLLWFVTLGVLGAFGVARNPHVLFALNPVHCRSPSSRRPI